MGFILSLMMSLWWDSSSLLSHKTIPRYFLNSEFVQDTQPILLLLLGSGAASKIESNTLKNTLQYFVCAEIITFDKSSKIIKADSLIFLLAGPTLWPWYFILSSCIMSVFSSFAHWFFHFWFFRDFNPKKVI